MQIQDFDVFWTRPHPPHHPDLTHHLDHVYKKMISALSAGMRCLQKQETAMKRHEKLTSWIVLQLATHQSKDQHRSDANRWHSPHRQHQSTCYPSQPRRRTALGRTVQRRSVQSASLNMTWGINWRDWSAFASFTKHASWNGFLGSKSARCIKSLDLETSLQGTEYLR